MDHLRRLILSLPFVALPLAAQQGRLAAATEVRAAPDGAVVAQLGAGTSWATGATRNGFTSVTIEAWVDASRFAGPRDSFPATIGGSSTLRIRETPSLQGRILGNFRPGAGIRVLERRDTWARVRREVWVPSTAIQVAAPQRSSAATTTPNAAPTSEQPAPTRPPASGQSTTPRTPPADTPPAAPQPSAPAPAGALRSEREVPIRYAPDGRPMGILDSGAIVTPQARERGWVKVRIEAWVPESELAPADTSYGATLTAADLRADPDGHRGRVVRWRVQVVGMHTADPLRRDMAANEQFLLTIGPAGENSTIYVTVPQSLVAQARTIAPLSNVLLTARIRTGKSNPTGFPILELISFVKE